MKTLLLLRHAKSSWGDATLPDHDRPLNPRGQRDVPRMGQWMREQGLCPSLIASSTAVRAQATAQGVAEACGYRHELVSVPQLYLGCPSDYVNYLRTVGEQYPSVLVVGHNPGLEQLLELLTGVCQRFPTAALAQIMWDDLRWVDLTALPTGQLVLLQRPKMLVA